ncbi:Cell division cycle protein 20 -like protein [Sarcoptes scabiei]|uniref:Cell division cycle protein 20 -like protein n=1 Tax=Sarcoptes scabiei TaxID=52283 RepID=A0A131ZTX8_SARSC|nr:Cell division cycle protein 20 -like protein [Sarcoptes scabiei]KPM02236.1 WD domain containing protein 11 [Sarcoptes scabiei]
MEKSSLSILTTQLENISLNNSIQPTVNISSTKKSIKNVKTPRQSKSFLHQQQTPSRKTPSRIRSDKENRKASPKTPANGDRFIPDRTAMNFEISHYVINNSEVCSSNESLKSTTMSELVGDLSNYRIMAYQNKAPLPPEGHINDAKVVYSSTKSNKRNKSARYISKQPERILDAPDIRNDYYLQLLDWNTNNILAVALNNEVYLWNAIDGNITNLMTLDDSDYVSSLSWSPNSPNHLAVGISTGITQLWDVTRSRCLRNLNNSTQRIGCMSWNNYIISNGSKDGCIYNHDVRVASSMVGTLQGHSQEICGLKWSPNGRMLASGGNDNLVNIWPNCFMGQSTSSAVEPLFKFTHHQAAVKALAWCTWRMNCLASGGGTNDRNIRIWNTQTGQCMHVVDTKSQVSSLLWSEQYRELISSHGYVNNELIIWTYPTFTKVAELVGHSARVLGMAMSADGSTVVSLGADETLRFWDCFDVDPEKKKNKKMIEQKKENNLTLRMNIR